MAADTSALTERLDALENKLSATQSRADEASAGVTGNSGTISSLESKLTSLQEKVTQASRQPDATALIAANALKMAIDRGGSFKTELDTYASVAPNAASIEKLRAFADKGVPTVADLNAWFGAVANRIVATENKLPADAGIWDQLVASARGWSVCALLQAMSAAPGSGRSRPAWRPRFRLAIWSGLLANGSNCLPMQRQPRRNLPTRCGRGVMRIYLYSVSLRTA